MSIISASKRAAYGSLCWFRRKAVHGRACVVAAQSKNSVRAYWYRGHYNFGDLLTPLLLRHYGCAPVYDDPSEAQLVATGSLLERIPDSYNGSILGSGFISENTKKTFPNANILAVRGALTRERLGLGREAVALGDPGLLASRMMFRREEKKFMVGFIPHYVDQENRIIAHQIGLNNKDVTIIDVQQAPEVVIAQIDQCQHILSSSLHGLIVADSLAIPNTWIVASSLYGGRFKFDDYYSSLGESRTPVVLAGDESLKKLISLTCASPPDRIEQLKASLHELWGCVQEQGF